jgi:hypothetical protein
MMKFEIIDNDVYAVKNAGYKLDFSHGLPEHNADYYKQFEKNYGGIIGNPRLDDDIDSFYDLDGASLCKGEDGNLYAVEYKIVWGEDGYSCTSVPAIWQRVKKSA